MNTLRGLIVRAHSSCTCTRASSSVVNENTRGLSNSNRSNQIPRKSGKKFYKNVISQKRDAQFKQVAELDSISKSLSKQRRNPALKLREPPATAKISKKEHNIRSGSKEGPIVDKDYSPLVNFSPDLLVRAQRLFTKSPFTRSVAESVEQVRDAVFEHHGHRLPEVAIVGRSNVGKSSLLNALLARDKGLSGMPSDICI